LFSIRKKEQLADGIYRYRVEAPDVARKARAGQFVVVRLDERGERIPLTIADFDATAGTLDIVFQVVGKTTEEMAACFGEGDAFKDLAGPLGRPTHIPNGQNVIVVGGGVGIAPIFPIARAMRDAGNHVTGIIGCRTKDLLIMEDQLAAVCDEFVTTTDDGTWGRCSLVTEPLKEILEARKDIDLVVAIGPGPMMRFCAETTRPFKVPTMVSLNCIMVDGTGMCGACRIEVGGETKFACADGPEFDGHAVNFDQLASRLRGYVEQEKMALDHYHGGEGCQCRT
jgi:ferredoxin/flavodoxin---NADP+ reductase